MGETGLKLEVAQLNHRRFDTQGNMRIMEETLKDSSSDLVVFPEMFLTGYTLGKDVYDLAVSPGSGAFDGLIEVAKETGRSILFGFPERGSPVRGQVFNSAVLLGPGGVMGCYRKMHLVDFGPFEEYAYFTPGKGPFMFQLKGIRIGVIICYDIFFPELTKYYAMKGADAVICLSASPSLTREYFEAVMRARAIENTVYFVYSNLVGPDGRMDFWGGAAIIGPKGEAIAKGPYHEEGSIKAVIGPGELERARRMRPTLRDTRKDLFNELSRKGGFGPVR